MRSGGYSLPSGLGVASASVNRDAGHHAASDPRESAQYRARSSLPFPERGAVPDGDSHSAVSSILAPQVNGRGRGRGDASAHGDVAWRIDGDATVRGLVQPCTSRLRLQGSACG